MSLAFTSVDHSWQEPAATEKVAFRALARAAEQDEFALAEDWHYVAFPWATLIDQLQSGSDTTRVLLQELKALYGTVQQGRGRRFTVCQHIRAPLLERVFCDLAIEVVFWPHTTTGHLDMDSGAVRYLPFPLFAAQTIDAVHPFGLREDCPRPQSEHDYLTSFVGAFNPNVYLSETRKALFALRDQHPRIKVIQRDAWHFDRAVYEEQMHGSVPCESIEERERRERWEYLDIMASSQFTFCPTGSGPNSIRLFEAISLGSIPIVMTESLALPAASEETDGHWRGACLFCADEPAAVQRVIEEIETMGSREIAAMQHSLSLLAGEVLPDGWARTIRHQLDCLSRKVI